jgi:hypothetical protein
MGRRRDDPETKLIASGEQFHSVRRLGFRVRVSLRPGGIESNMASILTRQNSLRLLGGRQGLRARISALGLRIWFWLCQLRISGCAGLRSGSRLCSIVTWRLFAGAANQPAEVILLRSGFKSNLR